MDANLVELISERTGILSTVRLVEAYNKADNKDIKNLLREWLLTYIKWFSAQSENAFTDRWVREYFELIKIEPRGENDVELIRLYQATIMNRIFYHNRDGKRDMKGLASILNEIYTRKTDDKWQTITPMVDKVVAKAISANAREHTFHPRGHIGELLAWYKTLNILKREEPFASSSRMFTDFKDCLKDRFCGMEIEGRCELTLLTAGVEMLTSDMVSVSEIEKHVDDLLLHLFEGVINEYCVPIDLVALENACADLSDVLDGIHDWTPVWFEILLALVAANLVSWKKPGATELFFEWYEKALLLQSRMKNTRQQMALQYAIMHQLFKAAINAASVEAKHRSLETLIKIGLVSYRTGWDTSVETIYFSLKLLSAASRDKVLHDAAVEALERAAQKQNSNFYRMAFGCWLQTRDFKAVMKENAELIGTMESESLFEIIKHKITHGSSTALYRDMTNVIAAAAAAGEGDDRIDAVDAVRKTPVKSFDDQLSESLRNRLSSLNYFTGQRVPNSFLEIEKYRSITMAENEVQQSTDILKNLDGDYDAWFHEISVRKDICCTREVVTCFNMERNAVARDVLGDWLAAYAVRFSNHTFGFSSKKADLEFIELARIEPRSERDIQLLKDVSTTLQNRIKKHSIGSDHTVRAIVAAFHSLDITAFADDSAPLVKLLDFLMDRLSIMGRVSYGPYKTQRSYIAAVHMLLVVMAAMGPKHKIEMQNRYKQIMDTIADKDRDPGYLPYRIIAEPLVKCLERQLSSTTSEDALVEFYRARLSARCIHYYITPEIQLGTKSVNIIRDACFEFLGVIESGEEKWMTKYDVLQAFSGAAMWAVENTNGYYLFERYFTRVLQLADESENAETQAEYRYAAIFLLSVLAKQAHELKTREEAGSRLLRIGRVKIIGSGWMENSSLLMAYYEAIRVTRKARVHMDAIEIMFEDLSKLDEEVIEDWIGSSTLERILAVDAADRSRLEMETLFEMTREEIGMTMDWEDAENSLDELKDRHKNSSATESIPFIRGMRRRDVRTMEFDLSYHDVIPSAQSNEIKVGQHLKFPQAAMAMEDLFSEKLFGRIKGSDIKTILVYGVPGCGKTSLAKRIALEWAAGRWGKMFRRVYRLEMRHINSEKYSDTTLRTKRSITTAFVKDDCKRRRPDRSYYGLLAEIECEIQKPTTLVIFDGLDKSNDVGNLMWRQTLSGKCRHLLVSRQFGNRLDHMAADLVVRCNGLNDFKLEEIVSTSLDRCKGPMSERRSDIPAIPASELEARREMLRHKTREMTEMWELAHIPIYTQAVCVTYMEYIDQKSPKESEIRPFSIIWRMICALFDYFVEKYSRNKTVKEEFIVVLEALASEAVNDGIVSFSEDYVTRLAKSTDIMYVLKETGIVHLESGFYRFTHKIYERFFFAKHLCRHLKERDTDFLSSFTASHKYTKYFMEALEFMIQSLKAGDLSGLSDLIIMIEAAPNDAIGVQQTLLKLNVVNDFLSADTTPKQTMSPRRDQFDKIITCTLQLFKSLTKGRSRYAQHIAHEIGRTVAKASHVTALHEYFFQSFIDQLGTLQLKRSLKLFGGVAEFVKNRSFFVRRMAEMLRDGRLHLHWDVRQASLETAKELVKTSPEFASLMSTTEDWILRSTQWDARVNALDMASRFLAANHARGADMLALALRVGSDSRWMVRAAVIRLAGSAVEADPNCVKNALPLIQRMCIDTDFDVRLGSMETLTVVAGYASEFRNEVFSLCQLGCTDTDSEVRVQAIKAFQALSQKNPKISHEITLQAKQLIGDNDPAVRVATLRLIQTNNAELSKLPISKTDFAYAAFSDEDCSVRQVALDIVADVITYREADLEMVIKDLYRLHARKQSFYRTAVWRALPAVINASPEATQLAYSIFASLESEQDTKIRLTAIDTLQSIVQTLQQHSDRIYDVAKNFVSTATIEELPFLLILIRSIVEEKAEYASDCLEAMTLLIRGDDGAKVHPRDEHIYPHDKKICFSLSSKIASTSNVAGASHGWTDHATNTQNASRKRHIIFCEDQGWSIRAHLVKTVLVCAVASPKLASKAMDLIGIMRTDCTWEVRKEVAESLKPIVECSHAVKDVTIRIAFSMSDDPCSSVKTAVADALLALLARGEQNGKEAFTILEQIWQKSDSQCREIIARKYVTLVNGLFTAVIEVITFGNTLVADLTATNRSLAIEVLRAVLQLTEESSVTLKLVKEFCTTGDADVRRMALKLLLDIQETKRERYVEDLEYFIMVAADIEGQMCLNLQEAIYSAAQNTIGGIRIALTDAIEFCKANNILLAAAIVEDIIGQPTLCDEHIVGNLRRSVKFLDRHHRPLFESIGRGLQNIFERSNKYAPAVYTTFDRLSRHASSHVRHAVLEVLFCVISMTPEHLSSARDLAIRGAQEIYEPTVEKAGLKVLAQVFQIAPEFTDYSLAFLRSTCTDEDKRIRGTALKILRSILKSQKPAPEQDAGILGTQTSPGHATPAFSQELNDRYAFIGDIDRVQELFSLTRHLSEDSEDDISKEAVTLMDEISTRLVIESLSNSDRQEEGIAMLAHKMIRHPVVYKKSIEDDTWQLIIYNSDETPIHCSMSKSQFNEVKMGVEAYLEQQFPGILKFQEISEQKPLQQCFRRFHSSR